ncbi:MAG TPA: S16 family serine protease, partial [Patescibacteria group bacterium]|nr:S16 family serine protease [Patescibacteria group bacterium]
GPLGKVMQESARAAVTFVRANSKALEIDGKMLEKTDIHVHVPEGAVPKDGPSAGITMTTALVSACTKRPVRKDVAMTGEVTLRGRVLEIGGLKEKVIAAHRAGIRHIILPKANMKDLREIPENVRKSMTFHPSETMDQVLKIALVR